jgi:outer membrane protein assembly factor BamB
MKPAFLPGLLLTLNLAVAPAALAANASAKAGDWPQWRGPDRDDVSKETGLLKDWPKGGPPLAWKATGLGKGYSTVSIVGDRIFTIGDGDNSSQVVCLNRKDGKILWTSPLGKSGAVGWGDYDGTRSTPATDGTLVFAVGQWGEFACYQASDGKEVWRKELIKDFGAPRPEWGFAESPLLDGEKVLMTPGGPQGAIVALNKKTGAVLWRSTEFKDPAHYSSIVKATIAGVPQYIQLTEQSLAAVAPDTGKLLWRTPRRGATAVIPTPIVVDDFVYVTSGYGTGCNLFKLTKGAAFAVEQVYANKVMANHHGGVIRVGDYIYGHSDGKGWTCQAWKTGNAAWQEKSKLGKGSIAYADGRFYLREEEGKGTVALIEATPAGYKEHGRFDPPDRSEKNSWAHPVIAGGKLYLRDQDVLLCYNVAGR